MSSLDRIEPVLENLTRNLAQESDAVANFQKSAWFVFENSEFCLLNAERYPEEWQELLLSGAFETPPTQSEFAAQLGGALEGIEEEEELHRQLRLFRRRQMIRIIWRDLHGTDLDEKGESTD